MPLNKAARFRYEIIDECLRNMARKWTKNDLLQFINRRLELHFGEGNCISISQLRYDLNDMQSECGAPIEMKRAGNKYYYYYDDPSFSIKNIPIEEDDINMLNEAVKLLRQIKGFTLAEDMAAIVKRLENRYKFTNTVERAIISFESSPETNGTQHLEDLYTAILRKKCLKISYQSYKATSPSDYHVSPYLLKEHAHRWYLLGYTEESNGPRVFGLDRMKDIRVVKGNYNDEVFSDGEDYFQHVIGVTVYSNQEPIAIDLVFSPHLNPYVMSKKLHYSQEILHQFDTGHLHIRMKVIPNPELISLILSYGEDVKIVQPLSLAKEIRKAATNVLRHYD